MNVHACRACRGTAGHLVLDLGLQPACDYFPRCDDPGPDPVHPLQMWLCSSCGLAQLMADPTVPEEPRGTEPAALVAQAAEAVATVAAAGLLPDDGVVTEYGSPHGGSWLGLLTARGLVPSGPGEQADVIVDCFGMMHAADQRAALAERAARLAPGGVLLLQYHALSTILASGQWNALRHGHYAYYSTTALTAMLAQAGLRAFTAWRFDLYGGTVLLAATRVDDRPDQPTAVVDTLVSDDARVGVRDPGAFARLQRDVRVHAQAVHDWLAAQRAAGTTILGYGAASRAVALLCQAHIDHTLLPAVIDASPAKQGLRMPGTDIPVVAPAELAARGPAAVLLFVPDLLAEVRSAYPEVEQADGRWVDVETLGSRGLQQDA
jgi:C-methyltransferase-like protein/putative zinc binding protein/methyltransferase family protein